MQPLEDYLVLDIETYTPTGKVDPEEDELRYIGFKDGRTGKKTMMHYSNPKIQYVLDQYDYYVGHNLNYYDIPVLKRYGYKFFYKKTIVDTFEITDRRLKTMLYIDLNQGDRSLSSLAKRFGLAHTKGEFDYSLLKADKLEGFDSILLETYLHGDLDTTDDLFRYYYELFFGLREYMSQENQAKLKWLTTSPGACAYKCVCNCTGLPEEYDDVEGAQKNYEGGFVSLPYAEKVEGDIYCIDFASLYPHMMIGGNLYSPSKREEEGYWRGSGVYPSIYGNDVDGIKGLYSKTQGKVEKFLQSLYQQRLKAKEQKDDKRSLAIKIIINTTYGIMGSPKFKSIYTLKGASDCTAMARRSIKHARTYLLECGYECIYTDTDSVYVLDVFKDFDKLKNVCYIISSDQRESFNVFVETHNFEIESKIKRMYSFKDDKGAFVKKHYCYIVDDGKDGYLVSKGVKVVKGDCSAVAKKIYDDIIAEKFLNNTFKPYDPAMILDIFKIYIKTNPELFVKRYRVNPPETYKIPEGKEEPTSIHYQIAKRYGKGEHWLVPNKRMGVGKGNKYATIEELKSKYGTKWVDIVSYETFMGDLKEFMQWDLRKNIHKIDRKRV